jgi:sigma-B regulation protein RsbU (phosphoserine phosphatase)
MVETEYKVLIVDDDPMLRKLLGTHLKSSGYEVAEACNGAEALAFLREGHARVAFVDYDMPGMNGIELCRQIRADSAMPFIHLVILTAHADRDLTIAALDAGANDFMTKPFHRGELLARLRAGERMVQLQEEAENAPRMSIS